MFVDPLAAGHSLGFRHGNDYHKSLSAPSANLGARWKTVAQAFGKSRGQFLGDFAAVSNFGPAYPADSQQQQAILRTGSSPDGFLDLLPVTEIGHAIESRGLFHAV